MVREACLPLPLPLLQAMLTIDRHLLTPIMPRPPLVAGALCAANARFPIGDVSQTGYRIR
jgi:hypothetical protein